ncbi:hypothetical protein A1O1_07620 [Capronia coronata CBS 617.96]|uniref:N-acetyltransferase domain-containing protein n=1 Tax=Capronia coronata CBS 617.96 TaxID=1182541 RepID=W9XX52_9EURO|nr:uncharacterized protein A1O1_07620 [Capronia coronata CBS 617.96]EXJ81556.1 hypothetical protein A1O1_07620 [Capronia coronata CBS 617.96]
MPVLHRLIVHPDLQRQGIGQKLLDWGIEKADQESLVAFLFARPAGSRLYERNGWKTIAVLDVEIPDPDIKMAPGLAMLRLPRSKQS